MKIRLLCFALALAVIAAVGVPLSAQTAPPQKLKKWNGCHFNGQRVTGEMVYTDLPSAKYRQRLDSILDKVGLERSKVDLRQANIDNAAATILNGRATILYNPRFLDSIEMLAHSKWAAFGVLAHEVGHLVNLQYFTETDPDKRVEMEFEADAYSARVLRKLCCLSHEEAQSALHFMGKVTPGQKFEADKYPPVSARRNHVRKKWEDEDARFMKEGNDPCKMVVSKLFPTLHKKVKRNLSKDGTIVFVDDEKVVIQYEVPRSTSYDRVHTRLIIKEKSGISPCHFQYDDDARLPARRKTITWFYPKEDPQISRSVVENADIYSVVSFAKLPKRTPTWEQIAWGVLAAGGVGSYLYSREEHKKKVELYDDVYLKYRDPNATIYTEILKRTRDQVKSEANSHYTKKQVFQWLGAAAFASGIVMEIVRWNKKHDYFLIAQPCGSAPALGVRANF